jgi:hypothetical protein
MHPALQQASVAMKLSCAEIVPLQGCDSVNNRTIGRNTKMLCERKAMKIKVLLGNQTLNHRLMQFRDMG